MRDVRSKGGATACVGARAGVERREASCATLWTIHIGTSPEGADVGVLRNRIEANARERRLDTENRFPGQKRQKAPAALRNRSSSVLLPQSSDVPATGAKAGAGVYAKECSRLKTHFSFAPHSAFSDSFLKRRIV